MSAGLCSSICGAVAQRDLVDHRGRGRDEVEVELALEPLLDDLEVEQAEEAAAEAEAERGRTLHLEGEARVVEAQPAHGGPEVVEIRGIDREQAAEHDRLSRLEAGQGLSGGLAIVGDRVADARIGDILDLGRDEADLAGAEHLDIGHFGLEDADAVDLVVGAGSHGLDAGAFLEAAVDDPHQHDDAEVGVVPAVDQQGLQGRVDVALGRRQALHDGFEHALDVEAGLGRDLDRFRGVEPDHVLDLLADALGFGGRKVDLVQDRHDLVAGIERLVDVGQRLGLDPLARIDDEQRSLAGRERAGDLVGEIDVARRVHQVEDVAATVLGQVVEPHRLCLDGDAALAFDIHAVEHLLAHVAQRHGAGRLDQPVGEGGFPMIDMGHDGEVTDLVELVGGHAWGIAGGRRFAQGRWPHRGTSHAAALRDTPE